MRFLDKTYPTILILLSLLLSGCGATLNPYHENFNCQAPADAGQCVDTRTAYEEATAVTMQSPYDSSVISSTSPKTDFEAIRLQRLAELLREPKAPILEPPKVLRVLILPYKGDGEELFMARYTYLKVDEAQWILTGGIEEK